MRRCGSKRLVVMMLGSLSAAACRPTPRPADAGGAPSAPLRTSASSRLPGRIGDFTAGPVVVEGDAERRTYTRGRVRIAVTLARFPMSAPAYAEWVRTSVEGFPQATLNLPAYAGNGFYQCSGVNQTSCDLLIQLRSGFHVEIRGAGTSSRADVDAIARGLRLDALVAPEI